MAAIGGLHTEFGDVGAVEILSSEKQVASGETGLGFISGFPNGGWIFTHVVVHGPHDVTIRVQLRQESKLRVVVRAESDILDTGFGGRNPEVLQFGCKRVIAVIDVSLDQILEKKVRH